MCGVAITAQSYSNTLSGCNNYFAAAFFFTSKPGYPYVLYAI